MYSKIYYKGTAHEAKCYFKDKECKILHREDGPAIETVELSEWYINGQRHREDGPAIEAPWGYKVWFLNGIDYEEEAFNQEIENRKRFGNFI